MPDPRADFVCLAKKCRTDEGATVYELPVAATRCPVCGSKRLQRIWSAQIATGDARPKLGAPLPRGGLAALDKIVEPAYTQAHQLQRAVANAPQRFDVRAVPIRELAPTLGAMGHNVALTSGTPSAVPATPSLLAIRGRGPRAQIIAKDK